MEEPRKIVLILGNGFDLDLGLKTSYKDFWESNFCPKDYPAPLIRHLNSKWGDNLESVRWYDLENELYEYALNGDKSDVVNEAERSYILNHNDYLINNQLTYLGVPEEFYTLVEKGYIQVVEDRLVKRARVLYREDFSFSVLERDRQALRLIKEGLCKYLIPIFNSEYNRESIALNVLFAAEKSRKAGDFVDIYTFNYTRLPVDYGGDFHKIVHHVHCSCSDNIIIVGTRDDVAIDKDYDFLQKSFDPRFDPPAIVADLHDADEVIFFGHSIGENDRQYFKAFFKQQTDYSNHKIKDITIFTRDAASEVQIKRSLQQMTDGNLSTLYCLNHIQIIKSENLVEGQRKMFDFLVNHHIERHHAEDIIGKLVNN